MRKIVLAFVFLGILFPNFAQESTSKNTWVFLSVGFVTPQLNAGQELLRSQALRDAGLSYYQNPDGTRAQVGSYSTSTGFALTMGFQKRFKPVNRLFWGAVVSNGQTGSQPSEGGYAEGYYFNFVQFGFLAKYYPLEKLNWFVRGETGLGSVLTKNRFLNNKEEQDFFHQFGIGNEMGLGTGYEFMPFSNKETALYLEANYQWYATRVEVSGIGDDHWKFGALQINAGIRF